MRDGPIVDLGQIVFIHQLSERASVIVADSLSFRSASRRKLRKMRDQVIAAPFFEFRRQARGPISSVRFERIREDGVWRSVAESLHQWLTDFRKMGGDCLVAKGIKHPPFRPDSSSLDFLPGVAGDEKNRGARLARW